MIPSVKPHVLRKLPKPLLDFLENRRQWRNIVHIGRFYMNIDNDIILAVYGSVFTIMKSVGLSFPTLLPAFRIGQAFHLRFPPPDLGVLSSSS